MENKGQYLLLRIFIDSDEAVKATITHLVDDKKLFTS